MGLRVFIVCEACRRQREVVVDGNAAVVEVGHDCDAESAFAVKVSVVEEDAQLTIAA